MTRDNAESSSRQGDETVARLDLARYLLRSTSHVIVVIPGSDQPAGEVAARLVRGLGTEKATAAAHIDINAAHDADHLAQLLHLPKGMNLAEPSTGDQLARWLNTREQALPVVVEDAQALPLRIFFPLLTLCRLVREREANMPIALVCSELEADRIELQARDAGHGSEAIHRIHLTPPAGKPIAVAAPTARRVHWLVYAAWATVPVMAAVVITLLGYRLMAHDSAIETRNPAMISGNPEPDLAAVARPPSPSSGAVTRADEAEEASDNALTIPIDFSKATGLPASVAPPVILANAPPRRTPPTLPERLVAKTTGEGAPQADSPAAVPQSASAWLESRDGGRYTLQFIAARKMATVDKFLAAHTELKNDARVVTVNADNGIWHLVLLGDYPTRATARQDVPPTIEVDDVYVRRFASVRD